MAEEIKKAKIIEEYSFGDGDFIALIQYPNGDYSCYGSVADKNIPMDKKYKYPRCAKMNAFKHIINGSIDYINKANRCEKIASMIRENRLERFIRNLDNKDGDKK